MPLNILGHADFFSWTRGWWVSLNPQGKQTLDISSMYDACLFWKTQIQYTWVGYVCRKCSGGVVRLYAPSKSDVCYVLLTICRAGSMANPQLRRAPRPISVVRGFVVWNDHQPSLTRSKFSSRNCVDDVISACFLCKFGSPFSIPPSEVGLLISAVPQTRCLF